MNTYQYTAYSAQGKRKDGVIIAETETHAATLLKGQGLFASQIVGGGAQKRTGSGRRQKRNRLNADLRAVFTRQMAVLLAADLPSDAALEAVRGSGVSGPISAIATELKAHVMEGLPLSEALLRADAGAAPFYLAAVRAGETSADLAMVFEELATYLETRGNDRAQIATALIYPGFVAAVSLVVCAILMINVAPEIVSMFAVARRDLPPLTKTMLAISNWIQTYWVLLLGGGILFTVGFVLALRVPAFRNLWHGVLLRLPVLGKLMRLTAAAQYLRTLALIIASRQTILEATTHAADVMVIARFRTQADLVSEAVRSGETLSRALQHLTVVPPVAAQLVNAGEASARLGRMSERAAVLVETWANNERKRFTALLDPILMMIVGCMVLVIVLSVLLPIFDLQSVIAG
jgi:general secretion pathway protein F